jgi:uncharacterized protein (DUF433 family)
MGATISVEHIVKTPGTLGGEPRIAGRRIGVALIVRLYCQQDTSVEELIEMHDLNHAQIYAALAYYYDHRQEIDLIIAEQNRFETEALNDPRIAKQRAEFEARLVAEYGGDPDADMTAPEIAETYGVSVQAVRKAATEGWIPARKSGATWLIKRYEAHQRWGKRGD